MMEEQWMGSQHPGKLTQSLQKGSKLLKNLGYQNELFIMPFDHRGSFQEKLFGIKGRSPNPEETQKISDFKMVIYEGFQKALAQGVPSQKAGILVDEQFGMPILELAKAQGVVFACPVEKSGQDEFDFEYGEHFQEHLEETKPHFIKVLVRYNPQGNPELNLRQCKKLKVLSDYCAEKREHDQRFRFMFELLVPPTPEQLLSVKSDSKRYDREMRPSLMVQSIRQLQEFEIEPDLWKLEGIEEQEDLLKVSHQVRHQGRDKVGIIILGRGENAEKVKHWLQTAALVPGLIGFAVGRTIFWDPLQKLKAGQYSRSQAVQAIGDNYLHFCQVWMAAREISS